MLFLRSLFFTSVMMITVPVWVIPGVLTFPFPFKYRYAYYRQWGVFTIWLLRVVCKLRYDVQGKENIPEGAGIVFSKHQSSWETIALQQIFPPQVWVLKKELLKVPFFGWGLAMLGCVAIDRGKGRHAVKQIVEQGTDRLQKGRWVVVFPEGTRTAPGTKKRYGVGGAVLAEKSGFPVVPVAHNAGEYWPRRGLIKKPGVIQVRIGPVINPNGITAEEIRDRAEQWIESTVAEISTLTDKPATAEA
jgi:1-acyl-sn-glycerol-3-phosphate acyltransferase